MKNLVYRAVSALILAILVSFGYIQIYHSMIVDFSEGFTFPQLLALDTLICFLAVLISGTLNWILKKSALAAFSSNSLLFITAIVLVFSILSMDDFPFKNEDAALFTDYFKGYLMPLIFIPYFAWFSVSPLFSKN